MEGLVAATGRFRVCRDLGPPFWSEGTSPE